MKKFFICCFLLAILASCSTDRFPKVDMSKPIVHGIQRPEVYLPLLGGKKVGLLSNATAISGPERKHSLNILLENGVDVRVIFSPEHGFREFADAGEHVGDMVDAETGIYIQSLYTKNPKKDRIDSVDVIVVDIQDVGLRYYTYYISMMRMMEKAVDKGKEFMILDRPNPNGMYVDGPILDMEKHRSGVGAAPIPIVHGLTLGELGTMVNEEGWLRDGRKVEKLHVVDVVFVRLLTALVDFDDQTVYLTPQLVEPSKTCF